MTIVTKLNDFTLPSTVGFPRLERDSLINDGSVFMLDFANKYCYADQGATVPIAVGTEFVDLVRDVATSKVEGSSVPSFAGGGLGFTVASNSQFVKVTQASDAAELSADTNEFLLVAWFKFAGMLAGQANATYPIAGATHNNSTEMQSMVSVYAPDGEVPELQIGANQYRAETPVTLGAVAQVAVYCKNNQDGTFTNRYFKDGVQFDTQTYAATQLVVPVSSTGFRLANLSGFNGAWDGSIYRVWQEKTDVAGTDPAVAVALDYSKNVGRFS
ncbi:MAG: hypothetical protein RPR40_10130 [Bermanella sp.]|jgi:hypothetical protein